MENVMQRHLEGAVVEAATKLVFTLISILFIAAGLFYEVRDLGSLSYHCAPSALLSSSNFIFLLLCKKLVRLPPVADPTA